jgi:serine acetyltransferase
VTIGMGGVVLNDITEAGTYVGVPVKKVRWIQ